MIKIFFFLGQIYFQPDQAARNLRQLREMQEQQQRQQIEIQQMQQDQQQEQQREQFDVETQRSEFGNQGESDE